MAKTGLKNKFEQETYDTLIEIEILSFERQKDYLHQKCEAAFENLGNLLAAAARQAADSSELILKLDAICLSGEYDTIEQNEGLDPRTKKAL